MEEVEPNDSGHVSGTVADADKAAGSSPQPPNPINNSSYSKQDLKIVEDVDLEAGTSRSFKSPEALMSPATGPPPLIQDADLEAGTSRSFEISKELLSSTASLPPLKQDSKIVEEADLEAGTSRSFKSPEAFMSPASGSPPLKKDSKIVKDADLEAGTSRSFKTPEALMSPATGSPPLRRRGFDDPEVRNSLYLAAVTGDWNRAKPIIYEHPEGMFVTDRGDTALHIAAAAQQTSFVEELVDILRPGQLQLRNSYGYRAICFAAISGTVRIAEVMVDKDPSLLHTCGYNNCIPLCLAMAHKRKDMVHYLLSVADISTLPSSTKFKLLIAAILADYYDIGLKIIQLEPQLALQRTEDNQTALHMLARKPHVIGSSGQLRIWEKYTNFFYFGRIYTTARMKTLAYQMVELMWSTILDSSEESDVLDFIKTPSRLLHDAAEVGNVEFLKVLIRYYPDIIWNLDSDYKSIFHVAVQNRQENVFRLLYEIGGFKDIIANIVGTDNETILHLAARQASPNHLNRVFGPALQMQRELQWFKEVEKIAALYFSEATSTSSNVNCLRMGESFTENHKKLKNQGEKWMKSTSNYCMLVAALISTVVFSVAFTVPGGNQESIGVPVFRNKSLFSVFVIADAAALFSSFISIMMFLSIVMSRFTQEDFLNSLSWRLLIGLTTLFISLTCMVVAFSTTFFMLYADTEKAWVPWAVAAMAIAPVTCFAILQYKLLVDTFRATFWSKYVFKPREPILNGYPTTFWKTKSKCC